jgi:hypothetical protein
MEYADKAQTTFQAMLKCYAVSWQGIILQCHRQKHTHTHKIIIIIIIIANSDICLKTFLVTLEFGRKFTCNNLDGYCNEVCICNDL